MKKEKGSAPRTFARLTGADDRPHARLPDIHLPQRPRHRAPVPARVPTARRARRHGSPARLARRAALGRDPARARRAPLALLHPPAVVRREVERVRHRRRGRARRVPVPVVREIVGRDRPRARAVARRGRRDERRARQHGRMRPARAAGAVDVSTACPEAAVGGAVRVHLFAHAGEKGAGLAGRAEIGHALALLIHLERDLVQLADGVAAHLARRAVRVADALGTFVGAPTDDDRLVVDLADDEHGGDDAGSEALEDHGLIVVDGNGGAVVHERDRVGWGRGVVGLRWWRWRCIDTPCGLLHINNVHHERVCDGGKIGVSRGAGVALLIRSAAGDLPQLDVRAMNEGVLVRLR